MDLPAAKGGPRMATKETRKIQGLPAAKERQVTDHTDRHGLIFKLDVMPYLLSGSLIQDVLIRAYP